MIKSGLSILAGDIFNCWWDAATLNILNSGCLYSAWESKTGAGFGKANQLESILPIGFLLDMLGVRLFDSGDLFLEERKPLIFPIQLIFRGTEITLDERETILCRPGGDKTILPRGKEVIIHL